MKQGSDIPTQSLHPYMTQPLYNNSTTLYILDIVIGSFKKPIDHGHATVFFNVMYLYKMTDTSNVWNAYPMRVIIPFLWLMVSGIWCKVLIFRLHGANKLKALVIW